MPRFLCYGALLILFFAFRQKNTTWVAIGDSITYLNDHPAETGNRVAQGYLTRVVKKMPHLQYINQGHNGWTSGGIADSIDRLGLVSADVYTVFLGTNDWWQGRPLGSVAHYQNNSGNSTVAGSFRIIVNKLRALNPQARIVLLTPMPRVDFVYLFDKRNNASGSYKPRNGQTLEQFADTIRAIGRAAGFAVVDLYHDKRLAHHKLVRYKRVKDPQTGVYQNYRYPDFTNLPFNPDTDEHPYPPGAAAATYDGLHPSDKGNAVIAKKLIRVLRQ